MLAAESVARCAALLADPSRAAMCLALLDGRAWTVGELARHAGIGPSTASEHVSLLVGGKLVTEERQGRHRYVRLAGHDVAHLVEDLAGLTGAPVRPSSLRSVRASAALAGGEDLLRPPGRAARRRDPRRAGAPGPALGALAELLDLDVTSAEATDDRATGTCSASVVGERRRGPARA